MLEIFARYIRSAFGIQPLFCGDLHTNFDDLPDAPKGKRWCLGLDGEWFLVAIEEPVRAAWPPAVKTSAYIPSQPPMVLWEI